VSAFFCVVLSYVGSADPPSKMSKNRFINFRRHSELEKARGPNPNLFFIFLIYGHSPSRFHVSITAKYMLFHLPSNKYETFGINPLFLSRCFRPASETSCMLNKPQTVENVCNTCGEAMQLAVCVPDYPSSQLSTKS